MPLPVTFATLTQGNQPLSLLDTQFSAISPLLNIPCTATGQNIITLTPVPNVPLIAAYTSLSPSFVWIQSQTTTGGVTIQIAGLAPLTAYGSNGGVALGAGDLATGNTYQCVYNPNLNSGAGGFVVNAFSAITTVGTWVPTVKGDAVAGTPTYTSQAGTYEQIGRQVTARFELVIASLTGCTGSLHIASLPFTNSSASKGVAVISNLEGWAPGGAYTFIAGTIDPSTSEIRLIDLGPNATPRSSPVADFSAPGMILAGMANYSV